eukprot:g239.t1
MRNYASKNFRLHNWYTRNFSKYDVDSKYRQAQSSSSSGGFSRNGWRLSFFGMAAGVFWLLDNSDWVFKKIKKIHLELENFQSRDDNKKKSIVEEEIEVVLAKENEGFHIKPYYPIILDSGASTTHLASSAVRGPKGKKLKFVTVREEFLTATSNIAATGYQANIGILKDVFFESECSTGLISIASVLDDNNATGIVFSLDGAWTIKLKDLRKLKPLLIARRDNEVARIKNKHKAKGIARILGKGEFSAHDHDMWYCEVDSLDVSNISIITSLQPLLLDTGATTHTLSKNNFKEDTKFTKLKAVERHQTPDGSEDLIVNNIIPEIGLLKNVRIPDNMSDNLKYGIVSPFSLLKDLHTKQLAFLFTKTCVYFIRMDDIKDFKKNMIGFCNISNGTWYAYPECFGLASPGSNKDMSEIWAKSEFKNDHSGNKKDYQIYRDDFIITHGNIVVSDGIRQDLFPKDMKGEQWRSKKGIFDAKDVF